MDQNNFDQGLKWQIGVWDLISELYAQEVDWRFVPVVEDVIVRAALKSGERVLDLGTERGRQRWLMQVSSSANYRKQ